MTVVTRFGEELILLSLL